MTAKYLRKMMNDIVFTYDGIDGSICPFSPTEIHVMFGGKFKDYDNVEDAMTDKFYNGKSLEEIAEYMT